MAPLTLNVLISTLGNEGVKRLSDNHLPEVEGVSYIIAWQLPDGVHTAVTPSSLLRDDITILPHQSIGVSKNRNYAIDHATADLCLTADDDIIYSPQGLTAIINTFAANPNLDLAGFKMQCVSGKWFPDCDFDLRKVPRGYDISEYEIAFRRTSVQGNIRFNELLGLNSPLVHAGEGPVFLISALTRGLNCHYYPITIGRQTGLTTGFRPTSDPGVMMAVGVVLYLRHGWKSFLYVPLNAWRKHRKGYRPLINALREITHGITYAHQHITP
jgi:glycosyltransferase involved in cell wall biosynthesis